MDLNPELTARIQKLEEKYQAMGQDITSYLDGLLYADYLTYWNYIHLDTLLTLQIPRTSFPDEKIFIMYHQVTELYFRMILHEFEQLAYREKLTPDFFTARVTRINRYFQNLTSSFDIMVDGMEPEQFMKYRMSLLPASGFQSAQYRMIEISSTDFIRLVAKDKRAKYEGVSDIPFEEMFEDIYWKSGATEEATGKPTLTLKQFEQKYRDRLIALAKEYKNRNLLALYRNLPREDRENEQLVLALRQLDVNVNINWPLVHYKSAVRYLQREPEDVAATGGTNWQKYLPPRFQKRIFYPGLWSAEELDNWGKQWVESVVRNKR